MTQENHSFDFSVAQAFGSTGKSGSICASVIKAVHPANAYPAEEGVAK